MSSVAVTNGKPNTSEDNDKDADDDKQSGSDKPAQEMTLPQFMTAAMSGAKNDYSELKTAIFGASSKKSTTAMEKYVPMFEECLTQTVKKCLSVSSTSKALVQLKVFGNLRKRDAENINSAEDLFNFIDVKNVDVGNFAEIKSSCKNAMTYGSKMAAAVDGSVKIYEKNCEAYVGQFLPQVIGEYQALYN